MGSIKIQHPDENFIDKLRKRTTFYLEDIETPIGKAINLSIAFLVILSSGIFVAQTYLIPESVNHVLDILDNLILVVFTAEYLMRLWCAESKFGYFVSLYSIIDLVAILPFLIGDTSISFIRLLRWFRLLRLIRLLGNRKLFGRISNEDSVIFARILFTLFAIVFIFSGLIYQVEHPINPQSFKTFLDAFYFSIFTMTTVGYGDTMPISETGRSLTVLMVLTGIALIPLQLGELIKRLVKTGQMESTCSSCGLTFHDSDAQFCKVCGTKLLKLTATQYQVDRRDKPID
jgi:voltage-gated potassium channel